MTTTLGTPERGRTIDVKVTVAELPAASAFWMRAYPVHHTFAELYQDCMNYAPMERLRASLQPALASRHFWTGTRFMRRADPLAALLSQAATSADGSPELSLVLRRDYYRIGPRPLVSGGAEHVYIDAEDAVENVIETILSQEQKSCCFDLCDWRGHRLSLEKSLADYELWPAWQDSEEFPDRADLRLRARTGWVAYALLAAACLAGLSLGYWVWTAITARV
jgi:hypothetical protein